MRWETIVMYVIIYQAERFLSQNLKNRSSIKYFHIANQILYILAYKSHISYSEIDAKTECVLYTSHTKREGNIWHNLGENTITLFFNINNEYMNKKQIE